MRPLAIAFLLFVWLQIPAPTPNKAGKPKQQQSRASQQPADNDQRGTEQSPFVVKTLEPTKSKAEAEQEAKDRQQKTTNDGRIVVLTGVLAIIALGQLGVYLYQAKKLRETVAASGQQSVAMQRHIEEAARSADAMEQICVAIQSGNKAVMRAYLTVVVGSAVYQERRVGQGDLKFEAKPNLMNTGNTPARKVCIRRTASILPIPIPEDFAYPLPDVDAAGDAAVGAHLSYIMNVTVQDFVPDHEVHAIKEGNGQALCVWGIVTYEDIFGDCHTTKFAQSLTWLVDGTVYGVYIPGQNDAG